MSSNSSPFKSPTIDTLDPNLACWLISNDVVDIFVIFVTFPWLSRVRKNKAPDSETDYLGIKIPYLGQNIREPQLLDEQIFFSNFAILLPNEGYFFEICTILRSLTVPFCLR